MPEQSQELIKWLWALIFIPIIGAIKLIWDNHVRQNKTEIALEHHRAVLEELIRKHQKWVSENHPTIPYFDQRIEDVITPLQLSILQQHQDMKAQNEKIDSILLHVIKAKK